MNKKFQPLNAIEEASAWMTVILFHLADHNDGHCSDASGKKAGVRTNNLRDAGRHIPLTETEKLFLTINKII